MILLKLRMLRLMWRMPRVWYHEIWKQDPSERICCSGYECGCMGADHGSYWEYMLNCHS